MTHVDGLLVGFIFCASLAVSLFFLRFWRLTRDRIFLAFVIVFFVEGVSRVLSLLLAATSTENMPLIIALRLVSYLLLIAIIVCKNRPRRE